MKSRLIYKPFIGFEQKLRRVISTRAVFSARTHARTTLGAEKLWILEIKILRAGGWCQLLLCSDVNAHMDQYGQINGQMFDH